MFISASSVCKSLQSLISALTQRAKVVIYLGSLVQPAVGREEHCKHTSLACVESAYTVWATPGLPLLTACVLSRSTLLRLQVALQGNCPKQTLGCMNFPGLSGSGSGSRALHKGTDSVGPAFCALPRSEQLRQPGAWQAQSPQVGGASYHFPGPRHSVSWVHHKSAISGVTCVSSGELISY